MILKFDKPITLEEARQLYNNNVKFVTDTENYPAVTGIEFSSDPRIIFKRKAIAPKVTRKSNKILDKYTKQINSLWDNTFSELKNVVKGVSKADTVRVTTEQRSKALKLLDKFKDDMSVEARERFIESYRLGKIRGQALSSQELDDDLSDFDEKVIDDKLEENLEYLTAFTTEIKDKIDTLLLEGPYESFDELDALLEEEVVEPKKSRAGMYAAAAMGLVAAGLVNSLRQANEDEGEEKIRGGYWTIHPEEGNGGEVCEGCLINSGKFFSIEDFDKEYQTNNCLTRCRCDLDTI